MKLLSEFIAELQEILEREGDMPSRIMDNGEWEDSNCMTITDDSGNFVAIW